MASLRMDLNLQFKEQDVTLISKTIEKVILFLIIYLIANEINYHFVYSLKKETLTL